jgi:hypothetical protein
MAAAVQRKAIEDELQRFTLRVTRRTVPIIFSMMLVQTRETGAQHFQISETHATYGPSGPALLVHWYEIQNGLKAQNKKKISSRRKKIKNWEKFREGCVVVGSRAEFGPPTPSTAIQGIR